MEHYFTKDTKVASHEREHKISFAGEDFSFITDHAVFSKRRLDYGSEVLLKSMLPLLRGRVLDLGCGYGPIGVIASKLSGLPVVMSDVNERAVALAKRNAERNRVQAEVFCSDGMADIPGRFDTILFNPPIRAGKELIYRLFAEAFEQLDPGGQLAIVIQKKQGADSARKELERIFTNCETLERSAGYHVLRAVK